MRFIPAFVCLAAARSCRRAEILALAVVLFAANEMRAQEADLPMMSIQRLSSAQRNPVELPPLQIAFSPFVAAVSDAAQWIASTPYPLPITRFGFAQNGESLYVISGYSNNAPTASVRRFDTATRTWTSLADIPFSSEAPVCVFYKDKIYVADGYGRNGAASQNLLRVYDVNSNSWGALSTRPGVVDSYGSAISAYNDKIILVGAGSAGMGNLVSIYDIATGTWSSGPPPPVKFFFGGYAQIGRYLYLAGGFAPQIYVNSDTTMRLDLATLTWSIGPVFTPKRGDFGVAAAGTKLYAIGGDTDGGGYFDGCTEVDELETATWPSGAWIVSDGALPSPRQGNQAGFFTSGMTGGEIWSTGGYTPGTAYLPDHLYRAVPHNNPPAPPLPTSVVSRKTHGAAGTMDLPLPLTGPAGIECRSGGLTSDFEIVLTFDSPVTVGAFPQAKIISGAALIGSGGISNGGTVSLSGTTLTVPLTQVANAQTLLLTVAGVTNAGGSIDITVPIRFLRGDANGDAQVNSADVLVTRNHSGEPVTASSFRADLNADGLINSADVQIARAGSGSVVPPAAPFSVVSRKIHGAAGAFDLAIPLSGPSAIECRSGGLTSDYELVLNFPAVITIGGTPKASVTAGSATIGSGGIGNGGLVNVAGSTVTIPLTNVANAQALVITLNQLSDANGTGDLRIPLRILIGDSNGDGIVNSADVVLARSRSGQNVSSSNFRADLNADGAINSADVQNARARSGSILPPPAPLSVVSRKTHGAAGEMDIPLPLDGQSGIECRGGGLTSDYKIVVTFQNAVSMSGVPAAQVTSGSAVIGNGGLTNAGAVEVNGATVTIPLTNVGNAQSLAVTLNGVTDGNSIGDVTIPLRVLVGDVNGDGSVNSADAIVTRSRSGQAVTAATFRSDVNADGAINSADATLVRARSGTSFNP